MLVFSIPFIQTKAGKYATNKINKEFATHINIERVGLQFNGDIELKKVYIEDYKQDTLISISELNTSILNFNNLFSSKLVFGDIDIMDLVFNIKTYKDTTGTNLDVFIAKLEGKKTNEKSDKFLISSSDVSIYNGHFRLIDENKTIKKRLDFENLNINATNFLINGSDVSTRINTLSFKDSRGVEIRNLVTNFSYTLTDMTFEDLDIETLNSKLKGDLKLSYKRTDLQFFEDKVLITASFKNSSVLLNELNAFYNEFGNNQYAKFSVNLSGTLNNLRASKLKLNTSRNTRIYGDLNFKNLFSTAENDFYMNADFKNLTSTYNDLTALLPNVLGEAIPSSFERLGTFKIKGNSQITASLINANIEIDTELGLVNSSLEISKINNIDKSLYKGKIIFKDFDMGTLIEDPKVGVASLDLNVHGTGFIAETLDTQVVGDVLNIVYNGYNYKNIKVEGNVRNKIFDGNLRANDKNLKLNFNGLVDFSETLKKYDFTANIDYANLNALNFVEKDSISIFKSKVKMNMNASNYDDAYGRVLFKNTSYKNQIDTYYFKEFAIASRFDNKKRFIEINSPDIIQGSLEGVFVFKDLKKLFENSLGHIYTNYIPYEVVDNQSIDFNFKIYNKIVEVFFPELQLGKNTFVRGRVKSEEEDFSLTFKSPEIKLLNYFANNIELQVDNSNPLFNTYVEVDSINTKYYNVSKFNLINVTVNDTLFMRSEFKGGKRNNDKFNLSFYHTINEKNESVIGFKKSDITIKNNKWNINGAQDKFNKISFDKKLTTFTINKLKANHNNEDITLSGFIKDSTQKDLKLDFKNVDLTKITPDFDSLSLSGNVNGKLDILQQNGSYLPNSTIVIDDFKVNNFDLGDFDATITGNQDLTNYKINASIENDLSKSFSIIGDINITENKSKIDVDLNFDKFSLEPLNPLLYGVLSNIRGLVTGQANIVGKLKQPDIEGILNLENSGLAIPYLNVDYTFNNNTQVELKKQSFIFKDLKLTDTKYNSTGRLKGKLSHVNLSKWRLDLDINTNRLLVLDTKETEESLYYGTGFMSGNATINGLAQELVINVIGETKKGTVFKIPLKDSESFGDNSYTHFITKEEKLAKEQGIDLVLKDVKGLELDFDLDITEDAEVELIIDKNTGHTLKGRGIGGLLIEINTNGKFNLWGDFSVFEGIYNFAYGGLLQKQFIVEPGGTLAWNGDPFNADIRMNAIYKTQANPSPLLDNPINRSIPVDLNIALTGQLEHLEPKFTFDFPTVSSTIKSELNYRLESTDIKQNQALYLLSTGAFSSGIGDLNFSGTIAERLNGIVNGIFSSQNGKFDFGFNYEVGENRPDYKTDDRVSATIRTKINDRVFINGKLGVPIGEATETVIAGDVEINFLLNEEGTLTAKVFNRENSIRNFGEDIGYEQGVGVSYNVDFDTFKELLETLFKKKPKKNIIKPKKEDNIKKADESPSFIFHKTTSKKR